MADILNEVSDSKLNLGRVGVGSNVVRSSQQYRPDTTLTDSLLKLGNTIAGETIAEAKKRQFYEGQSRILKASLDGSQREELVKIREEQPAYLSFLGQGAVADGAVEMAGKVGAGRMFDEHASRLANGQDVEIDPETYKENIYSAIEEQQTGDAVVDAAFLPQLISSGQRLVATQLTKNLEFKAASTVRAVVQDTWQRVNTLSSVIKAQYGYEATFKNTNPALMGDVDKQAYAELVDVLNPANAPASLNKEDYSVLRTGILVPEIEKGNIAYYDVIKQSGALEYLPAKERAALEKARKEGTELNYYNDVQFGEVQRYALESSVLDVKSGKDVASVNKALKTYLDAFREAGRPLPKEFDSAEKQQAFTLRAIKQLDMYEDKQEAKRQRMLEIAKEHSNRLAEAAAERAAKTTQEAAAADQIMRNSVSGNTYAPLVVSDGAGGTVRVATTPKMVEDTYAAFKSKYEERLYPNGRFDKNGNVITPSAQDQAAAKSFARTFAGKDTIEQVASAMRVVDLETKQAGMSLGSRIGAKEPTNADFAKLDKLLAIDSPDPSYLAQHVAPNVLPMVQKYKRELALELSYNTPPSKAKATAWRETFGRDITKVPNVTAKSVNDIMKQGAIKDTVKAASTNGVAVESSIREDVTSMLRSGFTEDEILTQVIPRVTSRQERVAGSVMLDVPFNKTIAHRTGFKRPEIVDAALDNYATAVFKGRGIKPPKTVRGEGTIKYEVEYNPIDEAHFIVPLNEDGVRMNNLAEPVNYEALNSEVNSKHTAPTITQIRKTLPVQTK